MSNCTGEGARFYVWTSKDGFPDVVIDSIDVPCEVIYEDTTSLHWTKIDLSTHDIFVNGDFHIGFTVLNPEIDTLVIVVDDGVGHPLNDSLRGSYYWAGLYWVMPEGFSRDHAFMINAVLCETDADCYDVSLIVDDRRHRVGLDAVAAVSQYAKSLG